MSAFIDDRLVAVTDGGEITPDAIAPAGANVIHIRPRLTLKAKNRLLDAVARVQGGGVVQGLLGAYELEIAKVAIAKWSGPDFNGTALTEANIERLDPDHPTVRAALDAAATRYNAQLFRSAPDPKSTPGTSGATSDGVASSAAG